MYIYLSIYLFFLQLIVEPIRGNDTLDLIVTNREEVVTQVEVEGQLSKNDH